MTVFRKIKLFLMVFCAVAFALSASLGGCVCDGVVAGLYNEPASPDAGWYVRVEIVPEKCPDGAKVSCDTGKLGVCQQGEQVCVNGAWSACKQLVLPSPEICDGLDNDCDGKTDEELIRECPYPENPQPKPVPPETKGVSHCRAGKQTCELGQWGACIGESLPREEVCNGKDDDCNGAVDEWLPIQKIGNITTYSYQGDPTHIYMVSVPSGYTFGWSEIPERQVLMSRVKIDATRYGEDWTITPTPEYGNIHGLTWTGKKYIISWDTDREATGSAYMAPISPSGKRLGPPVLLAQGGRMVNPYVASSSTLLGVIWADFLRQRLFAQPFNHDLKPLSAAKPYDFSSSYSPYPGLSVLGDNMAIAWVTENRQLWTAVLDRQGNEIGKRQISTPSGRPKDPYLSENQDGFLLVWTDAGTGQLFSIRLDLKGEPIRPTNVLAQLGAFTPILKPTSFGGVLAWIENRRGNKGIAIGRLDRDGKLLAAPSFQVVPGVRDYIALAWTDLGKGTGRGAVAWIDTNNAVKVAPLGCQP